MSLPEQERRSVERAWRFLLDLGDSYGSHRRVPAGVRAEARDIVRHFPLGGDLTSLIRSALPASESDNGPENLQTGEAQSSSSDNDTRRAE